MILLTQEAEGDKAAPEILAEQERIEDQAKAKVDRHVEISAAEQRAFDEQSETERLRKIDKDIRLTKEREAIEILENQRIHNELTAAKDPGERLERGEQERLRQAAETKRSAQSKILEEVKRE